MILKSIIMLSAFVTFVLLILHRLGLICALRLFFYSSSLFLLGKYSRAPPPPFPKMKQCLSKIWGENETKKGHPAVMNCYDYYDKLCSVIILLISRPCAYLHCNYIILRIPIYFPFGTISIYGRLTPRKKISRAFYDVTLTLFFRVCSMQTAYLPCSHLQL